MQHKRTDFPPDFQFGVATSSYQIEGHAHGGAGRTHWDDFAATTGLHEAEHVIKQLLAGATVAQLCSTLYQNGMEQVGKVVSGLEEWMERHDFESVDDFRGRLSQDSAEKPAIYERRQYIKHLTGIH